MTAPGVVADATEVPPAWGWLVTDGTAITTMREPAKTEAAACDRTFLAALLRRASKTDDAVVEATIERRIADREARFEERVLQEVTRRSCDRDEVLQSVKAFEDACGLKISDCSFYTGEAASLGRAVKAVAASGIDRTYSGLLSAAETARSSADRILAALKEVGVEPPLRPEPARRRRSAR